MLNHNAPSAPSAESKDDRKKKQDDLKEKFKQKLKEDKQHHKKREHLSNEYITRLYDAPQQFFSSSNLQALSTQPSLCDVSNISIFEHFYSAYERDKKQSTYTNNVIPFFKALKDKLETTLSLCGNSFLHFLCSYKKDVTLFMQLLKANCISNKLIEIKNENGDYFYSELLRSISAKRYKVKNADAYKDFFKALINTFNEFYNKSMPLYDKCELFIFTNNCTFITDTKPDPSTIINQVRALPGNTLFPQALDYLLNLNTLNYNFLNYLIDKQLWDKAQELLTYLMNTVNAHAQKVKSYLWVLPHFYYALSKVDLSKPFDKIKAYFITILNMLNSDTTGRLYKKMTFTYTNVYHYLFSNQSTMNSIDNMVKLYELVNEMLIKDNHQFKLDLLAQMNTKFKIPNKCKQIPALHLIRLYPNAVDDKFVNFVKTLLEPGIIEFILQTIYMKEFIKQNELQKLKLYYTLLTEYKQIDYNELYDILHSTCLKYDNSNVQLYAYLLELCETCQTHPSLTKKDKSGVTLSLRFVLNNCGFIKLQNVSTWHSSEYFTKLNVSSLIQLFLKLCECSLYSVTELTQLYEFVFTFLSKENTITFLNEILDDYYCNKKVHQVVNKSINALYHFVFPEMISTDAQGEKIVFDFFNSLRKGIEEIELLFIFGLKGEHCEQLKVKIFEYYISQQPERTFFYMFAYLLLNTKTKEEYETMFDSFLQFYDDETIRDYRRFMKKIIHLATANVNTNGNPHLTDEDRESLRKILDEPLKALMDEYKLQRYNYVDQNCKVKLKHKRYKHFFYFLKEVHEEKTHTLKGTEKLIELCCNPLFHTRKVIKDRTELYQLIFNGIVPIKIAPHLQNSYNQFRIFYKYQDLFNKYSYSHSNGVYDVPAIKLKVKLFQSKDICSHFLGIVHKKEKPTLLFIYFIDRNFDDEATENDDEATENDDEATENDDENDNESKIEFSFTIHDFATLPPEVLLYMYKKNLAIVFDNSIVNLFMCLLSPYFGNNIKQYTALFQQIIEVAPNNENAYNIQLKLSDNLIGFFKHNTSDHYECKFFDVTCTHAVLKQRFIDNLKLLSDNIGHKKFNSFISKYTILQDSVLQLVSLLLTPKESPKVILKCLPSIMHNLRNERNMQFFKTYLPIILKSNCLRYVNIEQVLLALAQHQNAKELISEFRDAFINNKIDKAKLQDQQLFFGSCLKFLNRKDNETYAKVSKAVFNEQMKGYTLQYLIAIDNVEYYVKVYETMVSDVTEVMDYAGLIKKKAFKIIHYKMGILSSKHRDSVGCISDSVCLKLWCNEKFLSTQIENKTQLSSSYTEYAFNIQSLPQFHVYVFKNTPEIAMAYHVKDNLYYYYCKYPIYSIHCLLCTFTEVHSEEAEEQAEEAVEDKDNITFERILIEPHLIMLNPFLFLECDTFEKHLDSFIKCLISMKEPVIEQQRITSRRRLSQRCGPAESELGIGFTKLNDVELVINNLKKLIERVGSHSLNTLLSQNPTINELLCQVILHIIQSKALINKDIVTIYMKDLPALSCNIVDHLNRKVFYYIIPWVARYNYMSFYDYNELFEAFIESDLVLAQRMESDVPDKEENHNEKEKKEKPNEEHIITLFLKSSFLMPSIKAFHNMLTLFFQFQSSDTFKRSIPDITAIINGNLLAMFTLYAIYMNDLNKVKYFLSLDKDKQIKSQFHSNEHSIIKYFNNGFYNKINTLYSDNLFVNFVKRNSQLTMIEAAIAIGHSPIVNYLLSNVCALNADNITDKTMRCIISTKNKAMYDLFKQHFTKMKDTHIQVILNSGCRPGNQFVLNYFVNEIKVRKQDLFYQSLNTPVPVEYTNNFYNDLPKEQRTSLLKERMSEDYETFIKLLARKESINLLNESLKLLAPPQEDEESKNEYQLVQARIIKDVLFHEKFKSFLVLVDAGYYDLSHVEYYANFKEHVCPKDKGPETVYIRMEQMESLYKFLKKEKDNIINNYSKSVQNKIEQIVIIGDVFFSYFENEVKDGKFTAQRMKLIIAKFMVSVLYNESQTKVENIIKHFLDVNDPYFMFTLMYLLIEKFKYPINKESLYIVSTSTIKGIIDDGYHREETSDERKNPLKEEYMLYLIFLYEREFSQRIIDVRFTFPIAHLIDKYILPAAIQAKTFTPPISNIQNKYDDPGYERFLKLMIDNEWFSIAIVFMNENTEIQNREITETSDYQLVHFSKEFQLVHFLTHPNNANALNKSFSHFQMQQHVNDLEQNDSLFNTRLNQSLPNVKYPEHQLQLNEQPEGDNEEDIKLHPNSFQLLHYHLSSQLGIPGQLNHLLRYYVFEYKKNEVDKIFELLYPKLEKDFESFITSKLNDIFKSKNNVDEHSPVIFVDENKSINKTTFKEELINKYTTTRANNAKKKKSNNQDKSISLYYETLSIMNNIILSVVEIYNNLLETFKFLGMQIQFIYTNKSSSNIKSLYEKGLSDFFINCFQNQFQQKSKKKKIKNITIIQFPFCFENESVLQPIQINTNLSPSQFLKLLEHVFNTLHMQFESDYSGYKDYPMIIEINPLYHFGKQIEIPKIKRENKVPYYHAKTPTFIEYIYTAYIIPNQIDQFRKDLRFIEGYYWKEVVKIDRFLLGYLERLCEIEHVKENEYLINLLVDDVMTYSKENTVPFKKLFTQEMFTPKLFEVNDIISYIYEGKDQYLQPLIRDVYQPIILYQKSLAQTFPEFNTFTMKFIALREFVDAYINTDNVDVSKTNKENINEYRIDIRKCLFMFVFSWKVEQSLKRVVEDAIVKLKEENTSDTINKTYKVKDIVIELGEKKINDKVKINPSKHNENISPFEFTLQKTKIEGDVFTMTLDLILKRIVFKGTYKEMIQYYLDQSIGK